MKWACTASVRVSEYLWKLLKNNKRFLELATPDLLLVFVCKSLFVLLKENMIGNILSII